MNFFRRFPKAIASVESRPPNVEYAFEGTSDLNFARQAVENVLIHRGGYKSPLFSRHPKFGLDLPEASRNLFNMWNELALDSIDNGGGSCDQTCLRELCAEMLVIEQRVLEEVQSIPSDRP